MTFFLRDEGAFQCLFKTKFLYFSSGPRTTCWEPLIYTFIEGYLMSIIQLSGIDMALYWHATYDACQLSIVGASDVFRNANILWFTCALFQWGRSTDLISLNLPQTFSHPSGARRSVRAWGEANRTSSGEPLPATSSKFKCKLVSGLIKSSRPPMYGTF